MASPLRMPPTSKWNRDRPASRRGACPHSGARTPSRVTQRAHRVIQDADGAILCDGFHAYGVELLGFARRSLRIPGLAEAAVQECFVRARRSRARFDPTLGFTRALLFTIQRRVILDFIDRQWSTSGSPFYEDELPEIEAPDASMMLGRQVASALDTLPPERRMAIAELHFHDRTGREVAALFGSPEHTVHSPGWCAVRVLRIALEEAGWEGSTTWG